MTYKVYVFEFPTLEDVKEFAAAQLRPVRAEQRDCGCQHDVEQEEPLDEADELAHWFAEPEDIVKKTSGVPCGIVKVTKPQDVETELLSETGSSELVSEQLPMPFSFSQVMSHQDVIARIVMSLDVEEWPVVASLCSGMKTTTNEQDVKYKTKEVAGAGRSCPKRVLREQLSDASTAASLDASSLPRPPEQWDETEDDTSRRLRCSGTSFAEKSKILCASIVAAQMSGDRDLNAHLRGSLLGANASAWAAGTHTGAPMSLQDVVELWLVSIDADRLPSHCVG